MYLCRKNFYTPFLEHPLMYRTFRVGNTIVSKGEKKMIATKNHQNLNELLVQEELIRSVAAHYHGLTKEPEIKTLYDNIITQSEKNSADIVNYLNSHI